MNQNQEYSARNPNGSVHIYPSAFADDDYALSFVIVRKNPNNLPGMM